MIPSSGSDDDARADFVELAFSLSQSQFLALQRDYFMHVSGGRRLVVVVGVFTLAPLVGWIVRGEPGPWACALVCPIIGAMVWHAMRRSQRATYQRLFARDPVVRWRFDDEGVHCLHGSGDLSVGWSEIVSLQLLPRMCLFHRRSTPHPLCMAREALRPEEDARLLAYLDARNVRPGPAPRSASTGIGIATLRLWLVLIVLMAVISFIAKR